MNACCLKFLWLAVLAAWWILSAPAAETASPQPAGAETAYRVEAPTAELKAPSFYRKFISANGYPIVASGKVNDYALKEAAYLVNLMLAERPDVRAAMVKSGSRMSIMAYDEFTTDLPEWVRLTPKDFWDARARGLGGDEDDPYCSCGEENLLAYPGDPYAAENILIHEFAHNIHLRGMVNVDPTFDRRLKATYDRAMTAGLWKGKYASVNHHEYFAEGVQSWFDNNRENDHDHNHVNTRAELLDYDPGLAAMCKEVFGSTKLVYVNPTNRLRDHLAGYDPATAPKFVWPERLAAAKRKIREEAQARSNAAQTNAVRTNATATVPAATTNGSPWLTLDRIFDSDEFSGESLGTFIWSRPKPGYFTLESPQAGGPGRDVVWNDPATGKKEIIVPAHALVPPGETRPLTVDGLEFSRDESKLLLFTNSKRVWRRNTRGDYWVLDVATRELKQLGAGAPPATLRFAKFSPDGRRVAYIRENNLYVQDVRDLHVTPLTTNGSPTLINGTSDWVYEEELDLRDGYRWSPDGESIAYWQLDASGVREFFLINNTDGSYSRPIGIPYPKVGEQNSAARLGVVSVRGGETRWLEVPGDPRNRYLAQMEWLPDATQLLVQQFNRLQNTNWVLLADAKTGKTRVILTETDPAWLENENPVRWAGKGGQFIWLSERDGWRHAYLIGTNSQPPTCLTPGDFDVIEIEAVDEPNGWLYYAASPDNPTQRYLYRTRLDRQQVERVTPTGQPGWHTYNISPDAAWAVHTYSTFTNPPVVELIRLPSHQVERVLVANQKLRDRLATLAPERAEFLRLDIGDRVQLDAWYLAPSGLTATNKHPILFYVYGEPHGQTVRDAWPGQRGLWHRMLSQQGYVVASVDNRGTMSPRGRDWRKVVHRQIGLLASAEQAAAARALFARLSFIDTNRVGIWGWSGGGSMSLNALFRYPDLYHLAMAVAPVPNQRLYDSIYQERYMGSPEDNAEGYRRGSPITYANRLQGELLLVHGTGDDNCHYQGVELLANELIAHNKPFTLMPYPNRTHAISEGRNTTRHLYGLLTRFLMQNLPAPAVPQTGSRKGEKP